CDPSPRFHPDPPEWISAQSDHFPDSRYNRSYIRSFRRPTFGPYHRIPHPRVLSLVVRLLRPPVRNHLSPDTSINPLLFQSPAYPRRCTKTPLSWRLPTY